MKTEDVVEIETYIDGIPNLSVPANLTEEDYRDILGELQEACREIGFKDIEEAHWIFIPIDEKEDIIWESAMGGEGNIFTHIGSTREVGYTPSQEEMYELLTEMRNAKWVIHIHNHPGLGGYLPISRDLITAQGWKSNLPEHARKLKFFVIKGPIAIEYATTVHFPIRWL